VPGPQGLIVTEDHGSQGCPVERPIGTQHAGAERLADRLEAGLAGLYHAARQGVGVRPVCSP